MEFLRTIDQGISTAGFSQTYTLEISGTTYATNDDKALLYNYAKTTLFYAMKYYYNIDLNESGLRYLSTLTTIGKGAFANMEAWNVFLPSNVTTIEDEAFKGGLMESIYFFSENPPSLGENVFAGHTTCFIHINNADSNLWKTAWSGKADNCKFFVKRDLTNITTPTFYDQSCEWDGMFGFIGISPTGSLEVNGSYKDILYDYTDWGNSVDIFIYRTIPTDTWSFIGNLQPARTKYKHLTLEDEDGDYYNFFAASPFDYVNNAWGGYASADQTMPLPGNGFFIYPFKECFFDYNYPFYFWWSNTEASATPNTSVTEEKDHSSTTIDYIIMYDQYVGSDPFFSAYDGDAVIINTNNGEVDGGGKWFALSNPFIGRLNMYSFYNHSTNKPGGVSKIQGGAIYTYNSTTNDWDDPLDITDPDNIVALMPGTGFLVASKDNASTLSLNFRDGQVLQKSDWSKLATTKSSAMDRIVLSATANGIEKRMLAKLDSDASNGFDGNDAYVLLSSNEDVVNPYFLVEGEHILNNHFNSLPYIADINFNSYKDNEVEFSVQNSTQDIEVSIIDVQNDNAETVLNNSEIFNISCTAGDNAGRYKIKFSKKNVGINEVAKEADNISIWNNSTEITVNGKNLQRVEIYNTLGQQVYSSRIAGESTTFDSMLNDGAYIIKVYTNNSSKSKKVIIK